MSDGKQLDYETEESTEEQRVSRDDERDLPIKEGAVFGIIGVLITYLTHLFLTMGASTQITPIINNNGDAPVATELVASWVAAGWSYLGTFGVGFEASGEAATLSQAPNNAAAISSSLSTGFLFVPMVLFAVTVGAIMAAGYGIARYTDADDPVDAVKAGLTVVPPYLVFAAIAALLMTHSYSDLATVTQIIGDVPTLQGDQFVDGDTVTSNIEFGAATSDAIIFAGILFPATFAVIGALITQGEDVIDAVVDKVNQ